MNKLISAVLGAIAVLLIVAGGPAVWWFDRHFAGWSFRVGVPIVFHYTFILAPGPVLAERAKTAEALRRRDLAIAGARVCAAALTAQNGRVQALAALGVSARARAEAAVRPHLAAMAAAPAKAATIAAALAQTPAGADECAKAREVDAAFVGTLK